jgi:hypothetical protein
MASRLLGRLLVVSMLFLPLIACSTGSGAAPRVKMSSKKLCESAGGTYAGKVCTPGTARSAESICQAQGGIYLAGEDNCDIPYSQ